MRNCLNDIEISAFVDGNIENKEEAIHHLNSCADCFDQVTTVMNLIDENQKSYEQLNSAYENMVLKQGFVSYFNGIKNKFANFIDDLMPSIGGTNTVSGFVLNRYSAIGATLIFAFFAVNIIKETNRNQFLAFKFAKEFSEEIEINASDAVSVKFDENDSTSVDTDFEFNKEPEKKNAFEIGKNVMEIEVLLKSGRQKETNIYFNKIFSNPLVKTDRGKQIGPDDFIEIEKLKKRVNYLVNNIDIEMIPYVISGMTAVSVKYKPVNSKKQTKKVKKNGKDINKVDDYFKDNKKLTDFLKEDN